MERNAAATTVHYNLQLLHTRGDERWIAKASPLPCTSVPTPCLAFHRHLGRHLSLASPSTLRLPNSLLIPALPQYRHTSACKASQPLFADHCIPLSVATIPYTPSSFAVLTVTSHWVPREKVFLCQELATMAGTGPEYDYPVTGKDEPIPVVSNEDPVAGAGTPVFGEDAGEMNDKDIAEKERLEIREAGEWSEDMASNEPLPGEKEDSDLTARDSQVTAVK